MIEEQNDISRTKLDAIWDAKVEKFYKHHLVRKIIHTLIITIIMLYLIFGIILGIGVVKGSSMEPALKEGDLFLFSRLDKLYHSGDIVLAVKDNRKDAIKRVVAIPKDTINEILAGLVLINDEPLDEPYIYEETHKKTGVNYPVTMRMDEYFLMGDSRENSQDSRNYGAVKKTEIYGRVIAVFRYSGNDRKY